MKQWTIVIGTILLATVVVAAAEQHLRLFVTPAGVKPIQEKAKVADSHHQLALADLKARFEKADRADGCRRDREVRCGAGTSRMHALIREGAAPR